MSAISAIACAVLLVAAIVFRFVLQGYAMLAYVCAYAALLILVCALAPAAIKRAVLAITVAGALAVAITEVPIVRASVGTSDGTQPYLVVLGAKVNGTEPSRSLRYRLEGALSYLEANPSAICIVSGGQGDDELISEAACMANWLQARGISDDRILLEDASTSTDENLANSFELITAYAGQSGDSSCPINAETVAVASSGYHLYRVQLKVERSGFSAATVPCYSGEFPLALNYYLREAFAVWAELLCR